MERQITALTKQEEEALKKALLDFVLRVFYPEGVESEVELMILPEMTNLILRNLVERC